MVVMVNTSGCILAKWDDAVYAFPAAEGIVSVQSKPDWFIVDLIPETAVG